MHEKHIQSGNLREKSPNPTVLAGMSEALNAELTRMRRNPAEFTVFSGANCKLCYKKTAFDLSHPKNPTAGSWCPTHGWLFFDSVKIPPEVTK